jgi:hypothetical protein
VIDAINPRGSFLLLTAALTSPVSAFLLAFFFPLICLCLSVGWTAIEIHHITLKTN